MRPLVVTQNITVDGVVEMLDDWFDPMTQDAEMLAVNQRDSALCDTLVLGRQTFEDFRGFWPEQVDDPTGVTEELDGLDKFVVSRTMTDPRWQNSTVIDGDPLSPRSGDSTTAPVTARSSSPGASRSATASSPRGSSTTTGCGRTRTCRGGGDGSSRTATACPFASSSTWPSRPASPTPTGPPEMTDDDHDAQAARGRAHRRRGAGRRLRAPRRPRPSPGDRAR